MFWVDEIVEDIVKKNDKNSYRITDWKTPSGHIHVGALRGVIVHDVVTDGLKDKEKQSVFQYGFDDFDPMDGLPIYVDKSWEEHMGKPLCDVPAPDGKSESYAAQYANEFRNVIDKLEIKSQFVYTSELYRSGKFDEAIKIVLDNADVIRKIYKEVSGSDKGSDWYPLQVICPKCGKLGTTRVFAWDGKVVKFRCETSLVKWAKGCGHEGEIEPFGGKAKLPWKVEWPSKWFVFKSDVEGEGKDHFAAGGSRDVADRIFREVFRTQPPYDIRYEHILIGGAKMSSSKGLGVTAKDMAEFLPASILRFLFIRTKYKRAIDFNPEGDTIPLLYDEYDRAAVAYREDPNSDLARSFYFTEVNLDKAFPEYLLRFSKIAFMLQMPHVDIFEYATLEKGSHLTSTSREEIENRINVAKVWLEKFAPENYKFAIQQEKPEIARNLNEQQKKFLLKISETVETKEKWTGEDLHEAIHAIRQEMEIAPRDAFSAIYLSFIGKDSGPQAGWLLANLDHDFVLKRLREATNA